MRFINAILILGSAGMLMVSACKSPDMERREAVAKLPAAFDDSTDSTSIANKHWRDFFADPQLAALIDTALANNPDYASALQDVEMAAAGLRARKGALFPYVSAGAGVGLDKSGRYTSEGAGNAVTDITPGQLVPEPLPDYLLQFRASWEVDIWGKLKNYKKAAYLHYLGGLEGVNYVQTELVAAIADHYYELLALRSKLNIIRQSIQLQSDQLEIVKVQKQAAVVTELAVKQFEAQLLGSRSREFEVLQQIRENENELRLLLGTTNPVTIPDSLSTDAAFSSLLSGGIPAALLDNRPDIRKAELEMQAAHCNVNAVKREFYPSVGINGSVGFQAFKPSYLFTTPESFIYSLAGELVAPLLNRSALNAELMRANAEQKKAMNEYRKTVLEGYLEVSNEMALLHNLEKSYELKQQEVATRNVSIDISMDLFKSAHANYLEVLAAQNEAIDSRLELVELRKEQYIAAKNLYRSLGGGWR